MKNFFFTLVVFFSCIVSAFAFSGGTGTANNPYLIANFSDWHDMINQSTSSAHYRLISDITIEPYIIPFVNNNYNGILHGGGHTLALPNSTTITYGDSRIFFLFGSISAGYVDSIKTIGNINYKFSIAASIQGGEINACIKSPPKAYNTYRPVIC